MTLDTYLATDRTRCPNGYAPVQHPRFCNCGQVPALKRAGIAAANNAPTDVKARVDSAILRLARSVAEFSANDLRRELVDVPGPLVGGRFNALAKRGLIVPTGDRVPSNLGSTHGHELKVWKAAA